MSVSCFLSLYCTLSGWCPPLVSLLPMPTFKLSPPFKPIEPWSMFCILFPVFLFFHLGYTFSFSRCLWFIPKPSTVCSSLLVVLGPFPSPCSGEHVLSRVQLFGTLWTVALPCPWDSAGKNTEVGCHFLLQGIFPTQGSSPHLLHLLHWQADFYHWAIWEALPIP